MEHPNLVKLIGYCAVDGERGIQRLLVYEFMPNKSLEEHLFSKAYTALSWPKRLQIVLGAAQGLAYLHEELEVQVCIYLEECFKFLSLTLIMRSEKEKESSFAFKKNVERLSLVTCCLLSQWFR